MEKKTAKERFEMKFKRGSDSECWEWLAAKTPNGYGKIMVDTQSKKFWVAHRFSYELYIGQIPEGIVVRHKCDNPGCVNPYHMELGTQKDNIADAVRRGRFELRMSAIGELNGNSKFSNQQVEEMRQLRKAGASFDEIAEKYGASYSHVTKLCRGEVRALDMWGQSSFLRDGKSKCVGDARRKVTSEMKKEIKSLFENGKTHQQIAEAVGLTQGHVSVVLQKLNDGKKQKPRLTEETINSIVELRSQGLSFAKIGEALGVPKPTVQSIIKRNQSL